MPRVVIKTKQGKTYYADIGFQQFQIVMQQARMGNIMGSFLGTDGRDPKPVMVPFGYVDLAETLKNVMPRRTKT